MAPFEQQREAIDRVDLLWDDTTDELRSETTLSPKALKVNHHVDRDSSGNDSSFVDDSSSFATTITSLESFTTTTAPPEVITTTVSSSITTPILSTNQPLSLLTLLSTTVPTTTASVPTITQATSTALPTAPSSDLGNELVAGSSSYTMSPLSPSSVIYSTTSGAPAVLGQAAATTTSTSSSTATSSLVPTETANHGLSPTAQHVLITAATIGAIVFVATIVYCVLRFLRIDITGRLRRITRKGHSSWRPGSFSGTENFAPPYTSLSDEKFIPSIRKPYAPIGIEPVPMAVLPSAQELARTESERQKIVREALLSKLEDTALYHETLQSGPERRRQPSLAYTSKSRPYSELSSLSSGFGDAKIDIPESGPTKPNSRRKSRASRASQKDINYSRFSWSSNPTTLGRSRGNRDTIYTSTTTHTTLTTSSEESGPRFRTVNSWVSHQAKRVHRQKEHDREVETMPALPEQAHVKRAYHQRLQSELTDPGFKYHPGDEVPLSTGGRVPSAILDKII